MCATAFTPGLFIAGHIIQGLFTSMMLIAAAPPLVLGWPTKRLPTTAMVMNLGIFGAVAAGPLIGGAPGQRSRLAPAVLDRLRRRRPGPPAVAAHLRGLPGPGPRGAPGLVRRSCWPALGCAAAFFGASELQTHRMLDLITFAPLLTGAGLLVALIIHQLTARNPLMPMRQLVHTFPVAAVTIAISAGAGSIALIELAQTALSRARVARPHRRAVPAGAGRRRAHRVPVRRARPHPVRARCWRGSVW